MTQTVIWNFKRKLFENKTSHDGYDHSKI